jgi:hypothetical protein
MSKILDDQEFTTEILRSKEAGQLTNRATVLYVALVENLFRKANYVNYPIWQKDNMRDRTIDEFIRKYDTFSLYRTEVRDFLERYRGDLKRMPFYDRVAKVIKAVDADKEYASIVTKEFGVSLEDQKPLVDAIDKVKAKKKVSGAFNFFTCFTENNFKKELKVYYKEEEKIARGVDDSALVRPEDAEAVFQKLREQYGF